MAYHAGSSDVDPWNPSSPFGKLKMRKTVLRGATFVYPDIQAVIDLKATALVRLKATETEACQIDFGTYFRLIGAVQVSLDRAVDADRHEDKARFAALIKQATEDLEAAQLFAEGLEQKYFALAAASAC